MEPVTMALFAKTLGTVVSTAGSMKAAEFNRRVAKNNAARARGEAASDAEKIDRRGRARLSKERVKFAKGGVDPGTGSAALSAGRTAADTDSDIRSRLYSGEAAATDYLNEASRQKAKVGQAFLGGALGAGTTLLTAIPKTKKPGGNTF